RHPPFDFTLRFDLGFCTEGGDDLLLPTRLLLPHTPRLLFSHPRCIACRAAPSTHRTARRRLAPSPGVRRAAARSASRDERAPRSAPGGARGCASTRPATQPSLGSPRAREST